MYLRTLGALELRQSDDAESAILLSTGKPVATIAYLSAAHRRSATRQSLISALWGDVESEAARHALRQALWYARRKCGSEVVTADGDTLRLDDSIRSDRERLLAAAEAGDHELVVGLYAGPFIPAFAVPGGASFEEWASLERRRLLELFRHSAREVVSRMLRTGHARDAVRLARRLRDADILNQPGWRVLLEACVSSGDMVAAKAEAEALLQFADSEDLELDAATQVAIQAATAATNGTSSPSPSPPALEGTLVGRERQFAQLITAWQKARSGQIARVHVSAPAGMGKTRLLRDLASRIRGMRGRVVVVSGSIGTRDVPFAMASDLAARLAVFAGKQTVSRESAAALVAMNPTLSTYFDVTPARIATTEAVRTWTAALRELSLAASYEHSIAILADDVHWWDPESERVVTAVLEGLQDSRILFCAAGRPEASHMPVVASAQTERLELMVLSVAQVEELVLSIAALPARPWAATLVERLSQNSHGSPLLVLEALQLLVQRGVLSRGSNEWTCANPTQLISLLSSDDVLRSRLEVGDRTDRWLLTILAVTGTSLETVVVARAADLDSTDALRRLSHLEERGLLIRSGVRWHIAHDELTNEICAISPRETLQRASVSVARSLVAFGEPGDANLHVAARLVSADNTSGVREEVFRLYAQRKFAQGDRRTPLELARVLFGDGLNDTDCRRLLRQVPISWRLGLVSSGRRLFAALSAVFALGISGYALSVWPASPPADAVLALAFEGPDGRLSLRQIAIRERDWSPQRPLRSAPWKIVGGFNVVSNGPFAATFDPRARRLYTAEAVEDDGVIDIFQRSANARVERLTAARGDDEWPVVSPDGRSLAFVTSRWDSLQHSDLARLDLASRQVEQLTAGGATDHHPVWSLDGARIAFARNNWGATVNQVCVIEVSSREVQCRPHPHGEFGFPLSWLDSDRLVVVGSRGKENRMTMMQWSTGESASVTERIDMAESRVSRDGRWVYCMCVVTPDSGRRPMVFPLDAPSLAREIEVQPGDGVPVEAIWIASRSDVPPVRVEIDTSMRLIPPHTPLQLAAHVSDRYGRELRFTGFLKWSLSPRDAASIDSARGIVTASGRASRFWVRASAGIDAVDSIELHVRSSDPTEEILEQWDDSALTRWMRFGRPVPRRVRIEGRDLLFMDGDGSFNSGTVSRESFDWREGLALDLEVSSPITSRQWQSVSFGFWRLRDTVRFTRAAGRNVVPTMMREDDLCGFGLPAEGETQGKVGGVILSSASSFEIRPFPAADLTNGRWYRVRVQLFPDARCGFAVDGVPVGVLSSVAPRGVRIHVRTAGNSVGTRILLGRLVVRRGVPNDVDWRTSAVFR